MEELPLSEDSLKKTKNQLQNLYKSQLDALDSAYLRSPSMSPFIQKSRSDLLQFKKLLTGHDLLDESEITEIERESRRLRMTRLNQERLSETIAEVVDGLCLSNDQVSLLQNADFKPKVSYLAAVQALQRSLAKAPAMPQIRAVLEQQAMLIRLRESFCVRLTMFLCQQVRNVAPISAKPKPGSRLRLQSTDPLHQLNRAEHTTHLKQLDQPRYQDYLREWREKHSQCVLSELKALEQFFSDSNLVSLKAQPPASLNGLNDPVVYNGSLVLPELLFDLFFRLAAPEQALSKVEGLEEYMTQLAKKHCSSRTLETLAITEFRLSESGLYVESLLKAIAFQAEAFLNKQLEVLQQLRLKSEKRLGILPQVEQIAALCNRATVSGPIKTKLVDAFAEHAITALIGLFKRMHERSEDAKERLNALVMKIENFHYLAITNSFSSSALLDGERSAIQEYCHESMEALLGEKLMEWWQTARLQPSAALSQQRSQAQKAQQSLRDLREHATYLHEKRLPKHFCSVDQINLVARVWQEMREIGKKTLHEIDAKLREAGLPGLNEAELMLQF